MIAKIESGPGVAVQGCSVTSAIDPAMIRAKVTWNTAGIIGRTPRMWRRE